MAVSFTQIPTSPNGSQSTIVYGVQGITTGPGVFQAKYVCDIRDNTTNELLVRLKQPANNSGYGVFEISDILHDYMEYDEVWKSTSIQKSVSNVKDFKIEFGEEYAGSASGNPTVYPAQIVDTLTIYPAVTDPIDGFNWEASLYYPTFLSSHPFGMFMRKEDYGTVSKLNLTGADVASYTIIVFDKDSNVLATKSFSNPYPSATANADEKLIHLPIGPANFKNDPVLNILQGDEWDYYFIITTPQRGSQIVLRLYPCSEDNGTRFAFINRQGVWDYWTASLTRTETENYSQDTYEQTFVDFSTEDGLIPYNSARRGTTVYNKKIDTQLTAQTDWLDKERADYLVELFQSPSVYVQYNDTFVPVIITNSSIQKKTNPRGQKLFSYKIEYKYANQRKARR